MATFLWFIKRVYFLLTRPVVDLPTIYLSYFSGCSAFFVYSCHSILECYNLFSGVKLSIRSPSFIRLAPRFNTQFENSNDVTPMQ